MKQTFLLFLLITVFQTSSPAQSQADVISPCPTIFVATQLPRPENIDFEAVISKDFDSSKLRYVWAVSNGKIISGQGSRVVTVDTVNLNTNAGYGEITVVVKIQGFPPNCNNTASGSVVCSHCGMLMRALEIDRYGKMSGKEEKTHLNKFADELRNHPSSLGFITKSFQRKTSKGVAYQNLQQILNYLTTRKIGKDRIVFGVTYDKAQTTSLFIIPAGAPFPAFNDEFLKAIDLDEKLKNSKPKTKKRTVKRHLNKSL